MMIVWMNVILDVKSQASKFPSDFTGKESSKCGRLGRSCSSYDMTV